jgi:hypothetical protein
MREEWFCSGPGGKVGPLTLAELKKVLARDPHSAHLYIWHESLPDWVRAADFDGLDQIDASEHGGRRRRASASDLDFGNYGPEEQRPAASKRRFSVIGGLAGVLLMILGCAVIYLGIAGKFTLVMEALALPGEEIDASVGGVFFVAGLVVIWVTRYRVK